MRVGNGSVLNQYKILAPIGKGGIGEVFLAGDTKLAFGRSWYRRKRQVTSTLVLEDRHVTFAKCNDFFRRICSIPQAGPLS